MNTTLINRVKRTTFGIFFKRIYPFLLLLVFIGFSIVFGLWNIKYFEFVNTKFVNLNENEIIDDLKKYIGENIFLTNPSNIENNILKNNPYVKNIYAKKILPNKILITLEEYTTSYIGYSSNKCITYSIEGKYLGEICENCENECKQNSISSKYIYIISDSNLENGRMLIFRNEFDMISKVLGKFGYELIGIEILKGITTIEDNYGHKYIFDISNELDIQLARMYLVGQKINSDEMEFKSVDLRFERPVMKF